MRLCLTVDSPAALVCSSVYLKEKRKSCNSQVNELSPVPADNLENMDLQTVNKPVDTVTVLMLLVQVLQNLV